MDARAVDGRLEIDLIHRWLALAKEGRKVPCVELLDDIAVDCRRENLLVAGSTNHNVQTQHRLSYGH